MTSGHLKVPFFSTHSSVRASGTHYFKPNTPEYKEIIAAVGDLEVGDIVYFMDPLSGEQLALEQSDEPFEEAMERLTKQAIEQQKSRISDSENESKEQSDSPTSEGE
jgi:hypothetical protein